MVAVLSKAMKVGVDGATIKLEDCEICIPPCALSKDTDISISLDKSNEDGLIFPVIRCEPSIQFNIPVTFCVKPSYVPESISDFCVYSQGEEGEERERIDHVSLECCFIKFKVRHFSRKILKAKKIPLSNNLYYNDRGNIISSFHHRKKVDKTDVSDTFKETGFVPVFSLKKIIKVRKGRIVTCELVVSEGERKIFSMKKILSVEKDFRKDSINFILNPVPDLPCDLQFTYTVYEKGKESGPPREQIVPWPPRRNERQTTDSGIIQRNQTVHCQNLVQDQAKFSNNQERCQNTVSDQEPVGTSGQDTSRVKTDARRKSIGDRRTSGRSSEGGISPQVVYNVAKDNAHLSSKQEGCRTSVSVQEPAGTSKQNVHRARTDAREGSTSEPVCPATPQQNVMRASAEAREGSSSEPVCPATLQQNVMRASAKAREGSSSEDESCLSWFRRVTCLPFRAVGRCFRCFD